MKYFKAIPYQVILFIFFVGCLASFINTRNTSAFGLQPRCIESLVEFGTVHLDNHVEKLEYYTSNYTWDAFSHNGHVYINKQPGQFFLGSIPYFFLQLFGVTYRSDFNLSCGVVTFFTSVVMTALIMVFLFNISFNILKNRIKSFYIASLSGFGTLLLPYSGILQHDMCATFFLIAGFYFLFYRYYICSKNSLFTVLLSGLFTGLSFFCSFNAVTIMAIICLYVIWKRNKKDIITFYFSLLVGLSVSFIFNAIVFGNPFDFSIVLYSNFFHQSHEFSLKEYLPSILTRINLYLIDPITAIEFYSPIYLVSYIGLFLLPKKYLIEKCILLLAFPLQFFQPCLFGVAGYGWCQYGPRYLLESIPFTMIGLSGYFASKSLSKMKILNTFIFFIGIISIIICAVGTIGVVYCNYYKNGFLDYLPRIILNKDLPVYYFLPFGVTVILISMLLYSLKYKKNHFKLFSIRDIFSVKTISFFLLIAFYFWLLSCGTWNLFRLTYLGTIFDSLGEGILNGTYEVSEIALAWEAFIVNGKYYAYWGPFPALLRIFFNSILKINYGKWANLSCLIAISLSLYAYFKSLNLVLGLNKELSDSFKEKISCISLLLFGLGSPFFFMASMGQVYHESTLWGFCFALFGIYYFLSYYFENKISSLYLLSLMCGLAMISRVTFFIPIGILFFLCLIDYLRKNYCVLLSVKFFSKVVLMLVPLFLLALFQADYNFKRFGSYITFADYKYYYLINNEKLRNDIYFKHGLFNVNRAIPAFKSFFFFNKTNFDNHAPYVKQTIYHMKNINNMLIYETLPFTVSAPWLLLISFLGMVFLFSSKNQIIYKLGLIGFFMEWCSILFVYEVHQRYVLDLMLGMIYLSFIFFTNRNIYKKKIWKLFFVFVLLLGVFSIFTNASSTIDAMKYFWIN